MSDDMFIGSRIPTKCDKCGQEYYQSQEFHRCGENTQDEVLDQIVKKAKIALDEAPSFSSGYPPLPPSCPFFTDHDCFGPCFHIWNGYCDGIEQGPTSQYFILSSMDDPKVSYMKPIIAAVARCSWNDTLRVKPGSGIRRTPKDVELAYRNSEAWRVWGLWSPA